MTESSAGAASIEGRSAPVRRFAVWPHPYQVGLPRSWGLLVVRQPAVVTTAAAVSGRCYSALFVSGADVIDACRRLCHWRSLRSTRTARLTRAPLRTLVERSWIKGHMKAWMR